MAELIDTYSKAPIVYITAGSDYDADGVLNQEECNSTQLWDELTQQKEVNEVLLQWNSVDIRDIIPFRMIIHKLERFKMLHSQDHGHNGSCIDKCKHMHFVLLWIPTNSETGMNTQQYNRLISAIGNSKYFCNKLGTDCVYISGPEYGHEEHQDEEKTTYDHVFDLDELQSKCRSIAEDRLPKRKTLYIEIAVHELANEHVAETIDGSSVQNGFSLSQQFISSKPDPQQPLLTTAHVRSFGGKIQYGAGPLPTDGFGPIYDKKSVLKRKHFVFALVWLHVKDKRQERKSKLSVIESDVDIDREENKEIVLQSEDNNVEADYVDAPFQTQLPAWTIMKKLHQQPYKRSLVYNVELFNYAQCWENQDLVVDRKILWKQAFLLLVQFYLLPFVTLCSPRQIIHCIWSDYNIKPRYRPVEEDEYIYFNDLDLIEQIPYDISALWGGSHRYKTRAILKKVCFRLSSFIFTSIIWGIVFIGPMLYTYKRSKTKDIETFLFFDCFGPFIFYNLAAFTIIWWSCATRIYIWPKEHELLYFKLIINRPIRRKDKGNRNIKRTDWAALANISGATELTTFLYSFRKGFLELKTPNHELLSRRPLKSGGCTVCNKVLVTSFFNIMLYFIVHNLENIEVAQWPIYISKDTDHYALKLSYNIASVSTSMMFVLCFIFLWETMFDRIDRHLDTIMTLRNLLIRNTYSEYIRLSKTENILSWMIMEKFLKRKGMMLFSSLEAPLFALAFLFVLSWSGAIFSLYEGVGQQLWNESSIFSNSALATWTYLGVFSLYQTARMLFLYGRKFTQETEKLENAFKQSCKTLHVENLMEYEVNHLNTLDQKYAMRSSQYILSHTNHDEIIPHVFGIQFDKLAAKAALGVLISTLPTIFRVCGEAVTARFIK